MGGFQWIYHWEPWADPHTSLGGPRPIGRTTGTDAEHVRPGGH